MAVVACRARLQPHHIDAVRLAKSSISKLSAAGKRINHQYHHRYHHHRHHCIVSCPPLAVNFDDHFIQALTLRREV